MHFILVKIIMMERCIYVENFNNTTNRCIAKIQQNEEDAIEETARLLAQAAIGQGTVYFACFGEMQG